MFLFTVLCISLNGTALTSMCSQFESESYDNATLLCVKSTKLEQQRVLKVVEQSLSGRWSNKTKLQQSNISLVKHNHYKGIMEI